MKKIVLPLITCLCGFVLVPTLLLAQANQVIPFQGSLYENGVAINSTVNITFSLADPAWTETHDNVTVVQGLYSVVLGQVTAFPSELFLGVDAPQLTVNIGGTDIATVTLHAPYISKGMIAKNMPDSIRKTFSTDSVEHVTLRVKADGNAIGENSAIEAVASTSDLNSAIRGFAYSQDVNTQRQTGLYGEASGAGTGLHIGVDGYASGSAENTFQVGVWGRANGSINNLRYGVRGDVKGDNTNYSVAVLGYNYVTPTVQGRTFGGKFRAANGADSSTNYGIYAEAFATTGRNVGVYGTAKNSDQGNWAGWFDGDVSINGDLMVNGQPITGGKSYDAEGDEEFSLNAADQGSNAGVRMYAKLDDQGGSRSHIALDGADNNHIWLWGTGDIDITGTYSAGGNSKWNTNQLNFSGGIVDSTGNELGYGGASIGRKFWDSNPYLGYVHVNGRDGANFKKVVRLEASSNDGVTNWGTISVEGANTPNLEIGAKEWEGSIGENLPYLSLKGSVETGDTTNGFSLPELVMMHAEHDQNDGSERGVITLRGTDGSEFTITSNGIQGAQATNGAEARNGQGELKGEFGYNQYDAGYLRMYGENDSLNVIVGSSLDGQSGWIGVFDSLGNRSNTIFNDANGTGQFYAFNATQNASGWFGNFGTGGFMQLTDWNDAGTATDGAVLAGHWGGYPEVYLELEDGNHLADLSIQNQMGKFWLKDSTGGSANLSGDGILTLTGGDGSEFIISSYGIQGAAVENGAETRNGQGDLKGIFNVDTQDGGYLRMYGNNDSLNIVLGSIYSGQAGIVAVHDSLGNQGASMFTNTFGTGQFRAYNGGGFYAHDANSKRTGWFGNTGDNGFMQLVDYNDAGTDSDGAVLTGFWGGYPELYMELGNNVHLADMSIQDQMGKFWLKDTTGASINLFGDGSMNLNATGGTILVNLGAKDWEGNNGAKRGFMHLFGTEDGLSQNDAQRIYLEVNDDGAGSYGVLGLKNSTDDGNGYGLTTIHLNGSNGNINTTGGVYASVLSSSDGTVQTSDARFKKNVKTIDNALSKTNQLNGYTYNWNKLAEKQKGITSDEEQVGVLAQELEAVFPQLVKTDEEGYKAVNYAALTAVLIEAIKELSAEVSTLKDENIALKVELTKVDALTAKIDFIEKLLLSKDQIEGAKTASK